MSEIDVRDSQCEKCAKFSHCNNNDLVCISKFQQLKAEKEEYKKAYEIEHNNCNVLAKAYNEEAIALLKLKKKVKNKNLKKENDKLKAENERLKELLSDKPIETVDIDSSFEIIKLKNCLNEIEKIVKCTCRIRCTNTCLGTNKYCGYGKILQKIKEVKDNE